MSDTATSLAIAKDLREQGFDNLLESQPEIRDAFIVLWQRGNSIRAAHRQLVERFPDARVPSVKALSTYVKKHLKHQTIDSRSPEYVQMMAKFDSVRQMYRIADEAERRYKFAVRANANFRTQSMLFNNMMKAAERVLDMELKLGLRQPVMVTEEPTVGQPAIAAVESSEETLDRGVELVQSFELFKAKLEQRVGRLPAPVLE